MYLTKLNICSRVIFINYKYEVFSKFNLTVRWMLNERKVTERIITEKHTWKWKYIRGVIICDERIFTEQPLENWSKTSFPRFKYNVSYTAGVCRCVPGNWKNFSRLLFSDFINSYVTIHMHGLLIQMVDDEQIGGLYFPCVWGINLNNNGNFQDK